MSTLRINAQRLWHTLETMARYGATANGGVTRLSLSEEDKQARNQLRGWAEEAGFSCRVDRLGNMFMRRPGRNPALAPVLTGSHGDSQPLGGRFDGIYGVLAGLEALRTLNDHGIETERAIELVNWTNEEGARFAPAMLASGVWTGVFTPEFALARSDSDGVTVAQALQAIGYAGTQPAEAFPLHACYELHIEQGPILEAERLDIGVVYGAQGQRWYEVAIDGFGAHAGTTPMARRRDALCGFAELVSAVERIGHDFSPDGRATVGMAQITPNSRNVVPARVFCSVEFRHPQQAALLAMEQELQRAVEKLADRQLTVDLRRIFDYAPISFDAHCVAQVRQAADRLNYASREMVSGAGHDACYINRAAPTAMIFIPCVEGVSHNEAENILPEWSEKGANVLLHAVLASAQER
ncbi:Zn-dependent hydrolase [Brenneria corticis]|uniref:Zn-dependent hydrolase n=1 Tax=Brenneria corticis TaxID=2173106 RepID=A0A2U1UAC1_9GAMM|nr:Zn-dependent hydrolase [Brenneria sp. CFCC 11842]PWC18524.1 Zn-dependent hydrolase [Brenneria sp. CFCC 11842]